jgi:regulatory protein SWI5
VKVNDLPNIQRNHGHRRGMSLDQRRRQTPPQDNNTVRNTNQGYQTTPQHILQETQQQRLARPGQQFQTFDNDENYLHSPIVTPHRQSFDTACASPYGDHMGATHYPQSGSINVTMQVDPNLFQMGSDFNLFTSEQALTPSAYLDFSTGFETTNQLQSGENSRRSSGGRRISGGLVDRVAQFESLSMKSPRPITPPTQNITGIPLASP